MKNWIKTSLLILLISHYLQMNAYAGFFDQLGQNLQKTLTEQLTHSAQPVHKTPVPTVIPHATISYPLGSVKKTVNIRSGPGTSHSKVGQVSSESTIKIINSQGNWLQVEADTARGLVAGWIYKPLVTINGNMVTRQSTRNYRQQVTQNNSTTQKNSHNIYYAGYSKEFQTVKKMMTSGNLKGVNQFYSGREAQLLKKNQTKWQAMEEIGLLRWMERGTLYLDQGDLDNSIKAFTNAENILNGRKEDSKTSDLFTSILSFSAETVTGNEEFQNYPGEGYEKVLMLNYKSISFLLAGQRKAYNVARRAIDWQNMEKALFRDRIQDVKKEAKKQQTSSQAKTNNMNWSKSYQKLNKIATKVASAFVNPFGYYVTGMIQEYESKNDRSLKDNARISYQKALELNPQSQVLKQAVKDMKSKKSFTNQRLLHVVVADGFVPEKKMLVYNYSLKNSIVPIKLPIYEPVKSKVARIEVQTSSGKRLATLSLVADIEAICLRHQKDTEAFRSVRMGLAITRAVGVNQISHKLGIFGELLSTTVNDIAAPDMRSWMSLPASLQAARLHINNNIHTINIVSYDHQGRPLANKIVKLTNKSDAFVYARSLDKQLYVQRSKILWTH
jgi:uncharacterized protein YraI